MTISEPAAPYRRPRKDFGSAPGSSASNPISVDNPPAAPDPISSPEQGAALLGLTVDQVRDSCPDRLLDHVDTVLTDDAWVTHTRVTASTQDGGRARPEVYIRRVLERAADVSAAVQRGQRKQAESDARHTCEALGRVDPTTQPRPVPWLPRDQRLNLSDRGHVAAWSAWLATATAEDVAQAAESMGLPPAPAPAPAPKGRRKR